MLGQSPAINGSGFGEGCKIGTDIHGLDPFVKEGCLNVGQICLQIGNDNTIEVIRAPYP